MVLHSNGSSNLCRSIQVASTWILLWIVLAVSSSKADNLGELLTATSVFNYFRSNLLFAKEFWFLCDHVRLNCIYFIFVRYYRWRIDHVSISLDWPRFSFCVWHRADQSTTKLTRTGPFLSVGGNYWILSDTALYRKLENSVCSKDIYLRRREW